MANSQVQDYVAVQGIPSGEREGIFPEIDLSESVVVTAT